MIEVIADAANLCGEGPLWDEARRCLWWVDISKRLVFRYDADKKTSEIVHRDKPICGLALNRDGRLVLVGETGVALWSPESIEAMPVSAEHDGAKLAANDVIADPAGRLYFGTCFWAGADMQEHGKLYLMQADGTVEVMDEGLELANGLGLSLDSRTLYLADSTRRTIHAYDVEARQGRLSNKRAFVQVSLDEGLPDGLTVDAEGYVWSAHWYGGQIVRYDPEGKVERRIKFPVLQTSSLTFGGRELNDLYVTSAAERWESPYVPRNYPAEGDAGGPLFRVRFDHIRGRRENLANLTL